MVVSTASGSTQGLAAWTASSASLRRSLLAAGVGFALASTAGAAARQAGPAPIVVTGSGSGPIRISQGGQERVWVPSGPEPMVITGGSAGDSAFDVPEPAGESLEAEVFDQGADPREDAASSESEPWPEGSSGYQSSSTLNQRLPGAASSPVSRGYAPSSSLNERMAAQASNQMNAWPAGDLTGSGTVQQWSDRGSQSRGGPQ